MEWAEAFAIVGVALAFFGALAVMFVADTKREPLDPKPFVPPYEPTWPWLGHHVMCAGCGEPIVDEAIHYPKDYVDVCRDGYHPGCLDKREKNDG